MPFPIYTSTDIGSMWKKNFPIFPPAHTYLLHFLPVSSSIDEPHLPLFVRSQLYFDPRILLSRYLPSRALFHSPFHWLIPTNLENYMKSISINFSLVPCPFLNIASFLCCQMTWELLLNVYILCHPFKAALTITPPKLLVLCEVTNDFSFLELHGWFFSPYIICHFAHFRPFEAGFFFFGFWYSIALFSSLPSQVVFSFLC